MMTVIVTDFEAAAFTVSETETEVMLLWTPNQAPRTSPLVIEAGQRYIYTDDAVFVPGRSCRRKR